MTHDTPYRPIDCSLHDRLEAAVVRRRTCRVRWRTEDGEVGEARTRLADVFVADGAEFLELSDGTIIRLDRLLEIQPENEAAAAVPSAPAPPGAVIASIQVGGPRSYGTEGATDPMDRPWTSAIAKEAVRGPVRVGRTNIEGDRQADPKHHGGPDKAVLAYAASHYPVWRHELPGAELAPGAFGENLTVERLTEEEVAIGDVWRAGSVTFQVSQPRQPCWKLARHLRVPDMVVRVQSTLRTGWYLRVLTEGELRPGDALHLVSRPNPRWTVAEASRVMHGVREDPEAALELAGLAELSESWTRTLRLRAGGGSVDTRARTDGPEG